MPKGVLWRNGDAMVECFGGSPTAAHRRRLRRRGRPTPAMRALITPPFMHGAGHWVALRVWLGGGTVFLPSNPEHLDPADIWGIVERERHRVHADRRRRLRPPAARRARPPAATTCPASTCAVRRRGAVGRTQAGAARPPPDGDDRRRPRLVGGRRPALPRLDGQRRRRPARSPPAPGNHVLSADLDRERWRPATTSSAGWPRAAGWRSATSATPRRRRGTYPVVDGVRYAVPGDRARWRADGSIELHGRDAVTINSGGEKIFAEEVEMAVKAHPGVYDCVVAGRPSERWGSEVVAIVRRRDGADVTPTSAARRRRPPHRPLQAAQGHRLRRRDRPLAVGQGRLPLGPPDRRRCGGAPQSPAAVGRRSAIA